MVVAPLVESGLHCGPLVMDGVENVHLVAPLVESGLHCGRVRPGRWEVHAGRPTRRERAPLRRRGAAGAGCRRNASPRSSRAGSIAARLLGMTADEFAASPRSSRAGSIAASTPSEKGPPRCPVAPLVESGLHCG